MKKIVKAFLAIILVMVIAFTGYTQNYYHANSTVTAYEKLSSEVTVSQIREGYQLDGPSQDTALIFYPGGKVEETAYLPLLMEIAQVMDVYLVKMPFRLAFFGMNKAEEVQKAYSYENWYISGHSLGGAMAAYYAANHQDTLDGVILFAAYPTKDLGKLPLLSIVGSQDHVINREKLEDGKQYAAQATYVELSGANHSQFGDYGFQKGDGIPQISAAEQWQETVAEVKQFLR